MGLKFEDFYITLEEKDCPNCGHSNRQLFDRVGQGKKTKYAPKELYQCEKCIKTYTA